MIIPPPPREFDRANRFVRSLPGRNGESDYAALRKHALRQCLLIAIAGFLSGFLIRSDFPLAFLLLVLPLISLAIGYALFSTYRTICLFSIFEVRSENLNPPGDEDLQTRVKVAVSKRLNI